MTTEAKKQELLKMFSGFPSTASLGEAMVLSMAGSYLETISSFSSDTVIAACNSLRRRPREFPPTAGEVHSECERIQWEAIKAERISKPVSFKAAISFSRKIYSIEEMADWNLLINHCSPPYYMRVDSNGMPLKIPTGFPGAGNEVEYGYLTPSESRWVRDEQTRLGNEKKSMNKNARSWAYI